MFTSQKESLLLFGSSALFILLDDSGKGTGLEVRAVETGGDVSSEENQSGHMVTMHYSRFPGDTDDGVTMGLLPNRVCTVVLPKVAAAGS